MYLYIVDAKDEYIFQESMEMHIDQPPVIHVT